MKTKNILSAISTNELKNISSVKKLKDINKEKNDFYINYLKPKLDEQNIELDAKVDYFKKLEECNELCIEVFERFSKKNWAMKFLLSFLSLFDRKKGEEPEGVELSVEQKELAATEIASFIKMSNEFDTKCNEYMEEYIIPKLNELAKNTKIIFDRNSNDERVKLITLNTEKKFMKNIKLSAVLVFYTRLADKEDKDWFDSVNFVYNDNIEQKKEFANEITNTFVERYDNLTLDDE